VRGLVWGLAIFLMVAFQGAEVNFLEIGGIRPDLVLIAVYGIGLFQGEFAGGLAGLGLGWVIDLFSVGKFYQNMITKGLIGVFAGYLGNWLRHAGLFLHLWILLSLSLLQGTLIAVVLSLIYDSSILSDLWRIVLPQAIYDAVLGSLVLSLISSFHEKRRKTQWVTGGAS
jgi:rod shape-determining protein MreD